MTKEENPNELTDAEAELYDRQIRLWGLESQKRLRTADILMVGLNGYAAEVTKNIILAGVKSVTFLDHRNLKQEDFCSQFLAPRDKLGENRAEASLKRAQNLNPMVQVSADKDNIDDKPDDYFKKFSVISVTECSITQMKRLNKICNENNIKFFIGDVWGMFGFTFADLGTHEFVEDVSQKKKVKVQENGHVKEKMETTTVTQKKVENFVPFEKVLEDEKVPKDVHEYFLMKILLGVRELFGEKYSPMNEHFKTVADVVITKYNLGDSLDTLLKEHYVAQLSPVCAVLGGVMGQEIIKTVSQKEAPHNNLFFFHPLTMLGSIKKFGQ